MLNCVGLNRFINVCMYYLTETLFFSIYVIIRLDGGTGMPRVMLVLKSRMVMCCVGPYEGQSGPVAVLQCESKKINP